MCQVISSVAYDWPRGRLVFCSLVRVVLVPLIMLCATPRDSPALPGEAWSVMLSALLGITNGYFGSVPMILAPGHVPDNQKELTGRYSMRSKYSLFFCFTFQILFFSGLLTRMFFTTP